MGTRSITVDRQPFDPGPAAWNEILPPVSPFPPLMDDQTADVVIIGAGFAGLSAARRLHQIDRKLDIVVLEARRVGEGPAGRNSGFMIDLPHNLGKENYVSSASHDQQQTMINRGAISFAREAAAELAMAKEAFEESGKINAAATAKGHAHNLRYARHLEELSEEHELLDEQVMQDLCGSSSYLSGLFTPGTAMLQPALYIREMAAGLAKGGISICENSAVTGMRRVGLDWEVVTNSGKVTAQQAILATNGHVESFGFFRHRLMHVYLYASMTAPLDNDRRMKLGGKDRWAFTPADPMGTTVRRISGTGGTRLIVRNGFTWAPNRMDRAERLSKIARAHDRSFTDRFPQIADCPMEYRWGGLLCLSLNAAPAFGRLDDNLFSACCQNGLGTAMGTASGMAIAELAMKRTSPMTDYFLSQPEPKKLPPEPLASIGAKALMGWREWRAGREL